MMWNPASKHCSDNAFPFQAKVDPDSLRIMLSFVLSASVAGCSSLIATLKKSVMMVERPALSLASLEVHSTKTAPCMSPVSVTNHAGRSLISAWPPRIAAQEELTCSPVSYTHLTLPTILLV